MRLSKAQHRVYENAVQTIKIAKKYGTYSNAYDNEKAGEQSNYTVGCYCNFDWDTQEKVLSHGEEGIRKWNENESYFNQIRDEQTLILFAKTETILALEKAGLIKIVESAQYKGGCETVKVLAKID
jgi:hypothetical protein